MNKIIVPLSSHRPVGESRAMLPPESEKHTMDDPINFHFDALLKQHAMEKGNLVSLPMAEVFSKIPPGGRSSGKPLYVKGAWREKSCRMFARDSNFLIHSEKGVGHCRSNALVRKYVQPHLTNPPS